MLEDNKPKKIGWKAEIELGSYVIVPTIAICTTKRNDKRYWMFGVFIFCFSITYDTDHQ